MKQFILILLFAGAIQVFCKGNTFYLSNLGSDDNIGTSKANPWKTIEWVNSFDFAVGDSILLKGEETFSGPVIVNEHKIYVGSYDGTATIIGPSGVQIFNFDSCKIENLILISAYNYYSSNGVEALLGYYEAQSIFINRISASGFQWSGISLEGLYRSISITNCITYENQANGITISTNYIPGYDIQNLHIDSCKSFNNDGFPMTIRRFGIGHGISISNASNALIEHTETYGNGSGVFTNPSNGMPETGHPGGIVLKNVRNSRISNCISHENRSGNNKGGSGFILFSDCAADTIENCISYENEGPGYQINNVYPLDSSSVILLKNNRSTNDAKIRNGSISIKQLSSSDTAFHMMVKLDSNTIYQNKRFVFDAFSQIADSLKIENTKICLTDSGKEYTELPPPNVVVTNTTYICDVILSLPKPDTITRIQTSKFSIYPNPIHSTLIVQTPKLNSKYEIRIVNSIGIVLISARAIEGKNTINVGKLPAGMYLVQILNPSRIVQSEKIIRL
ncbi:MAG: T9SS type A sorting domain-containing protein [Bacteroidota bacterium]